MHLSIIVSVVKPKLSQAKPSQADGTDSAWLQVRSRFGSARLEEYQAAAGSAWAVASRWSRWSRSTLANRNMVIGIKPYIKSDKYKTSRWKIKRTCLLISIWCDLNDWLCFSLFISLYSTMNTFVIWYLAGQKIFVTVIIRSGSNPEWSNELWV